MNSIIANRALTLSALRRMGWEWEIYDLRMERDGTRITVGPISWSEWFWRNTARQR